MPSWPRDWVIKFQKLWVTIMKINIKMGETKAELIWEVSDCILLDHLEVNLFQHDDILKFQSITHNQYSAPRFKNFTKYAWFKAGYMDQRPEAHITPVQYCFEMDIFQQNCQKLTHSVPATGNLRRTDSRFDIPRRSGTPYTGDFRLRDWMC